MFLAMQAQFCALVHFEIGQIASYNSVQVDVYLTIRHFNPCGLLENQLSY